MASSQVRTKLMEEKFNHIDQLFRDNFSNSQATPPEGVFEHCLQQLNHLSAAGNQVGSTLGNVAQGLSSPAVLGTSISAGLKSWIVWVTASALLAVSGYYLLKSEDKIQSVGLNNGSEKLVKQADKFATENLNSDENTPGSAENSKLKMHGIKQENGKAVESNAAVSSDYNNNNNNHNKFNADLSIVPSTAQSGSAIGNAPGNGLINVKTDQRKGENTSVKYQTILEICKGMSAWRPAIQDISTCEFGLNILGNTDGIIKVSWGDGSIWETASSASTGDGVNKGSGLAQPDFTHSFKHKYLVDRTRDFNIKIVYENWVRSYGSDATNGSKLCKDSQVIKVTAGLQKVLENDLIPDYLTPNGDGFNDEFWIAMPEPMGFEMTIFDPNGKLIFRTENFDDHWKGYCGSTPCSVGNYRVVVAYKYAGDKSWRYHRKPIKIIE